MRRPQWNGVQLGVILRMGWVSIAATMFFDDGDPAQPAEVGPLLDWPPGVRPVRDWSDWDIEGTGPLDDREGVLSSLVRSGLPRQARSL